jgi:hypothetical protein
VTAARVARLLPRLAAALLLLSLSGCQAVAITAFGAGASAGISHTINGIAIRTFAAATDQVHAATLAALRRLGMRYETLTDRGKLVMVKASAGPSRNIEIEYKELTRNATQIQVAVKTGGLLYDRATADEIIQITERQLADMGT